VDGASGDRRAISSGPPAEPGAISKMPTEKGIHRSSLRGFRAPPQQFLEVKAAAI
jgi:hypothetical protein